MKEHILQGVIVYKMIKKKYRSGDKAVLMHCSLSKPILR
jgi:hypothetical protein